ncbi:conserved Plasmodium protein, unknown function [Plasmodium ovale curtisi]|uniref:Uncharacterized protein n=1 Tax=Plasmodium ovale curtisi TaxID=864141 RepID=A0A1A8WVM8_PLAOA|nr:conserved Plasmodium protein, unknown function [Plasmodium ovale curtisi]
MFLKKILRNANENENNNATNTKDNVEKDISDTINEKDSNLNETECKENAENSHVNNVNNQNNSNNNLQNGNNICSTNENIINNKPDNEPSEINNINENININPDKSNGIEINNCSEGQNVLNNVVNRAPKKRGRKKRGEVVPNTNDLNLQLTKRVSIKNSKYHSFIEQEVGKKRRGRKSNNYYENDIKTNESMFYNSSMNHYESMQNIDNGHSMLNLNTDDNNINNNDTNNINNYYMYDRPPYYYCDIMGKDGVIPPPESGLSDYQNVYANEFINNNLYNEMNKQSEDSNKPELENTSNHINRDNNITFENKEEYLKNLIKELASNNDEKENYMKCKQIENEELRFEKLKELIIDMKIKEKKIDVILSSNENVFKYFNLYRQRYFLHEKMLINWSYVENSINKKNDVRNRNLPFQLLELDNTLLENVQNCYDDILLDNFSGIMLTLNTKSFETNVDDNSIYLSKIICGCLIEYIDQSELNIKCIWAHPLLNAKSTYSILSAFLPRVILEAFLNKPTSATTLDKTTSILGSENHKIEKTEMINDKNSIEDNMIEERKEKKKNSFYNRLNKLKDSKNNANNTNDSINNEQTQYLKKFALYEYPAMYYLNFNKNCALVMNNFSDTNKTLNDQAEKACTQNQQTNNYSYPTYNENNEIIDTKNSDKFLYIIFSDIDIFPRQCYLLFCSYKYMCLNMHYETDTCYMHSDLNLKNIQKENIGKDTYLSNICPCAETKEDPSNAEDACERIIGK